MYVLKTTALDILIMWFSGSINNLSMMILGKKENTVVEVIEYRLYVTLILFDVTVSLKFCVKQKANTENHIKQICSLVNYYKTNNL